MKKRNVVFVGALLTIILITVVALCFNQEFFNFSNLAFELLTTNFSWLYLLSMLFFVVFVVGLGFSKYGNLKLGSDDSVPEHGTISWFAMLFCAGMGVGLVFWGISEPVSHFLNPVGLNSGSPEAAQFAFKSVFMHWGIHPWANYAIIGLALAYFQFRKKKAGLISSVLEPLIGEKRTKGWLGKIIDILASFATVAGVVTSLGLGVLQISSGLNTMFDIPNTLIVQILIIIVVTIIFICSALSGVDKGVKKLSNLNLILALVFIAFAIIVGPKVEMLNNMMSGLGQYINNFTMDSLNISAYGDNSWIMSWRVFYWAWWIAWAPFVGVFIARISKGRTIREFIMGVVLAPTLASIIWFSVFGTLGIHLGVSSILSQDILQTIANVPESGLFIVLQQFPCGTLISVLALVLLCSFFITSADSGTFVLAMLSSNGNINPPNYKKIIWGVIQSVLAIALLIAGGLKSLQTISIIAAFPFMFVMIGASLSLLKSLVKEKM